MFYQYWDTIQTYGLAATVRMDKVYKYFLLTDLIFVQGREAAVIAFSQLRLNLIVKEGRSVHNTRIEQVWSKLVTSVDLRWNEHLEQLRSYGWDPDDEEHRIVMMHLLLPLVQDQLNIWVAGYNSIKKTGYSDSHSYEHEPPTHLFFNPARQAANAPPLQPCDSAHSMIAEFLTSRTIPAERSKWQQHNFNPYVLYEESANLQPSGDVLDNIDDLAGKLTREAVQAALSSTPKPPPGFKSQDLWFKFVTACDLLKVKCIAK